MNPKLLIEASAGCGKTYRIEKLVLDLIEEGFEIKEMVIVTFTKAQAADLRKRIYSRLKSETGKKAKRALQLFDEANISTLHSMAQKMLHEKGPDIDFHFDKIATFTLFKKLFITPLRHDVPRDLVTQEQLKRFINEGPSLLKGIHQSLAVRKEVQSTNEYLVRLKEMRARYPFSFEEVSSEVQAVMPYLLKDSYKTTDSFKFVDLFKSSSWGYEELQLLLKYPVHLFPEEGWMKKAPKDLRLPFEMMEVIFELHTIYQEAHDQESVKNTLAAFCRDIREKQHKDLLVHDDFIFKLNDLSQDSQFQAYFKERYKIAIIDEFQDTDEKQWQIFDRLFDRIYLVGDPKQSIYRFRNADIYTYQSAKETIPSRQTLDTNWRSDPILIERLNRFFLTPEPLFRLPRENTHLPYQPVKAGKTGSKGQLIAVVGDSVEAFTLHMINQILKEKDFSNWACLVNKNSTAEMVAKQLSDLSIPYYVQRSTSLSRSAAGISLYQILMAMKRKRSIKAALISPLIAYSDSEIAQLDDLNEFEEERARFERYQNALDKNFSVFVSLFENDFISRLRGNPPLFYEWEGLVEEILIWNETNDFESYYESSLDNQERRFVGDPQGVQILTIHGSKGLEFENVFVLGLSEKQRKEEDEEASAELMRLLYVAMTRAKTKLYIPVKNNEDNLFTRYLAHWNNDYQKFILETGCEVEPIDTAVLKYVPTDKVSEALETLPKFLEERLLSYTQIKKRRSSLMNSLENLLPKGAQMGIFLHEILEKIPVFSTDMISIKGNIYESYEEEILKLFDRLFKFPFIMGKSLSELSTCRQMREVPFTYSIENNLVHGIIDLVIEVEGEIYIVDWKSHALSDFSDEALSKVVVEEDFILQAKFYHEAATRHFGKVKEVLFVFMRGPGVYRWIP